MSSSNCTEHRLTLTIRR